MNARAGLEALLNERLAGTAGAEWLAAQDPAASVDDVRAVLPLVGRQVGRKHLIKGFAARADASVEGPWGAVPVGHWTVDQAVAVLLLARAADTHKGDAGPYATLFRCYDQGDTTTRVAALCTLSVVAKDDPAQGLQLVLDAGRTYLPELLGAAWCHNPFSAANLSEFDYRKAVLKAFFCEIPIEGFLRLEERADAELAQSLCEYIDERLAAGRSVPRAIWAVAAMHPRPGLVARLIGNLEHPDREERLAAARALTNARDPRASSFAAERLERESDEDVRQALQRAVTSIGEES